MTKFWFRALLSASIFVGIAAASGQSFAQSCSTSCGPGVSCSTSCLSGGIYSTCGAIGGQCDSIGSPSCSTHCSSSTSCTQGCITQGGFATSCGAVSQCMYSTLPDCASTCGSGTPCSTRCQWGSSESNCGQSGYGCSNIPQSSCWGPAPGPTPAVTITKTDSRTITDLEIQISFDTVGYAHHDWEWIGNFDRNKYLTVSGLNGSWIPGNNRFEGDFLKVSTNGSASSKPVMSIMKTDERIFSPVCFDIFFKIDGNSYFDWECLDKSLPAFPWTTVDLVLDAWGGTFDSAQGRWIGDFLRKR